MANPVTSTGDSKPLPRLPLRDTSPPPLTPAATTHLNRILLQAFENEKLSLQWLPHLESALLDLVEAVRRGGWTGGARQKRLALRAAAKENLAQTSDEKTMDPTTSRKADAPLPSIPAEDPEPRGQLVKALALLDERMAVSIVPAPSPKASHLLITLTSPDVGRHLPDLGIEFELRPHRLACSFTPGTFSLPFYDDAEGVRRGNGGFILTGLEEWKGIFQNPAIDGVRIVGGNFMLKGVHAGDDFAALTKVLRLGIYSALSLQLELSVFRDQRIPLRYPPPPSPFRKPIKNDSQTPSASTQPSPQKHRPTRRAKASSGIWNFLTKKTEGFMKPIHMPSRTDSESVLPASRHHVPPASASPLSAHFPHRIPPDLVRTFSHQIRMTTSDYDVQTSPAGKDAKAALSLTKMFSNTISRMEDEHSVFSTSPDVRYPPPSLLLRLARREERLIVDGSSVTGPSTTSGPVSPNGKMQLTGEDKTGLSSLLGWPRSSTGKTPDVGDPSIRLVGTEAFVRHQRLTVLYAEHVPTTVEPLVKDLVNVKAKEKEKDESAASSIISETQTIEGDVTSTASIDEKPVDAIIDEATAEPSSQLPSRISAKVVTKPCAPARWRTYRFYSPETDRTLGEFVLDVCSAADADTPCNRNGCERRRKEHWMDWIHAAVKVTGFVLEDENSNGNGVNGACEEPKTGDLEDVLMVWCSCKVCGKKTERVEMCDGTFLSSFAKFLELTIYSPSFASLVPVLCEHTSSEGSDGVPVNPLPTPKRYPAPSLPPCRFNIRRHFQQGRHIVTFSSSPLDSNVYEVKIPRIQIIKDPAEVKKVEATAIPVTNSPDTSLLRRESEDPDIPPHQRERDELRLEITYWWSALKDHIVKLEDYLAGETTRIKTKRLPSTPNDSDGEEEHPSRKTDLQGPGASETPSSHSSEQRPPSRPSSRPALPSAGAAPPSPSLSDSPDLYVLLQRLRQSFQTTEQSLYKLLNETPNEILNDVRRSFRSSADGAKRRLSAWQEKHMPKAKGVDGVGEFDSAAFDPGWWGPGHHLMPRSRIIVREKDWGSIIAFALSSEEYKRELFSMAIGRMATTSTAPGTPMETQRPTINSTPSNLSIATRASASTSKLSVNNAAIPLNDPAPDPDASDEGFVIWQEEDESYSAVITRKEHPKDTAGILGLRDVLRNQRIVDSLPTSGTSASGSGITSFGSGAGLSTAGSASSRFSALGNSASKLIRYGIGPGAVNPTTISAPPRAWAKAELEISLRPAQGELMAVTGGQSTAAGSGGEKLSDILAQAEQHAHDFEEKTASLVSSASSSESTTGHATIKSAPSKLVKAPSAVEEADESSMASSTASLSTASGLPGECSNGVRNAATAQPLNSLSTGLHSRESTDDTIAPPVPSKDATPPMVHPDLPSTPPPVSRIVLSRAQGSGPKGSPGIGTTASTTGSLSSTVASAIRYVLGTPVPSPPPKQHLGLLAIHGSFGAGSIYPPIDERPHLKYDFTLGKRLKFSCTVYYARQFDFLRKRCGIEAAGNGPILSENDIVRSLERCVGWEAEGGKSKSSFLKTEDDRFIIKTLVNAWNVADLQVLLELAPSYFRYMDTTSSHASVLAKLMGFYTIEVQNLDPRNGAGTVKMKADLLVMENLFWNLNMESGRTFDLKGITGRKVKHGSAATTKDKMEAYSKGETRQKGEKRRVKLLVKTSAPAPQKPLFDGEWIEGQQKTLILVEPHSKAILKEAIKSDAEFLAINNIMDYSLLLGIDQSRRQIACGLVDTIGSYTFAKTLEYKAKQGLTGSSGREITVVPPAEYQERFVNAMEGYFIACPDKWSKSAMSDVDCADVEDLPSVF